MSIIVKELTHSRSLVSSDSPSGQILFGAYGSGDPEMIELAVAAKAPGTFAGLVRDTITLTPNAGDEQAWEVQVSYRKAKRLSVPGTGDEIISFDVEPQQLRITHSKETVAAYGPDPPNFARGIGYQSGEFEGTQKYVPQLSFSITKYVPTAYVTNAMVATLRAAAFHVNASLWRGQAPKTCMFMGVSGSKRNEDDFALTYQFLAVEPESGLTFGQITGVSRGAWEHLWVLTEPSEDTEAQYVVETPKAVYIERIYDAIDFPTYLGLDA